MRALARSQRRTALSSDMASTCSDDGENFTEATGAWSPCCSVRRQCPALVSHRRLCEKNNVH